MGHVPKRVLLGSESFLYPHLHSLIPSIRERLHYRLFEEALDFMPLLKKSLEDGTFVTRELMHIGDQVSLLLLSRHVRMLTCSQIQAGAAASRADDIKSLKPAILDWITNSENGLVPPIPRNNMAKRGWNHDATGEVLCPAGLKYSV